MAKKIFNTHFEWLALSVGLLLMVFMNPYVADDFSWCLLEFMEFPFCPGEGLGHSIAYTVRGELNSALKANMMGPAAVVILLGRIGYLLKSIYLTTQNKTLEYHG